MEKDTFIPEPLKINYLKSLDGLSNDTLKKKIKDLYKETLENPNAETRSEKTFWRTMSQWEEADKCTIEDICITLGWYFHFYGDEDPGWEKIDGVFSQEQKEQIQFPAWTKNSISYSPYGENDYPKKSFPHWSQKPHSRY